MEESSSEDREKAVEEPSGAGAAGVIGGFRADAGKTLCAVRGRGLSGFFSFDHMYFPIVARCVFIVVCLFSALATLLSALTGLWSLATGSIGGGLLQIIGSVVFGALWLCGIRIWFELILLGFTINGNIEALRDKR